jgi:hypothetical protein
MSEQKPSHEVEGIVRRALRQDCVEAQIWGICLQRWRSPRTQSENTVCEHSLRTQSVRTQSENTVWEHSLRTQSVNTVWEHSLRTQSENTVWEHSLWTQSENTVCENTVCENTVWEHSSHRLFLELAARPNWTIRGEGPWSGRWPSPDGHSDRALEFLCGDGRTFQKANHLCSTSSIRPLW